MHPAEEGRKFTWSITLGGTSDYVFRGISFTNEDPASQAVDRLQLRHLLRRHLGFEHHGSMATPPRRRTTTSASSRFSARSRSTSASSTTRIRRADDVRRSRASTTSSSRLAPAFSPITNLTVDAGVLYSPEQVRLRRRPTPSKAPLPTRSRPSASSPRPLAASSAGTGSRRPTSSPRRRLHLLERRSFPRSREVHLRLPLLGYEPRFRSATTSRRTADERFVFAPASRSHKLI